MTDECKKRMAYRLKGFSINLSGPKPPGVTSLYYMIVEYGEGSTKQKQTAFCVELPNLPGASF